jgi:hypothetical protein
MKRGFSFSELGHAIQQASAEARENGDEEAPESPTSDTTTAVMSRGAMPRSKSLTDLDTESDDKEPRGLLPSISTLGLSSMNLHDVHGLEVLKRSAREGVAGGGMTSLPRSLSNSSLSQLVLKDDDIGAASALMELCGSDPRAADAAGPKAPGKPAERLSAPDSPPISLPPLRELLGGGVPPHAAPTRPSYVNFFGQGHGSAVWDELSAAALGSQMQALQQLAVASKMQGDSAGHKAVAHSPAPARRDQHVGLHHGGAAGAGEEAEADGKHNKYCHFCQHVKVKRATSMLACENSECARRFCEHCLKTHLSDVVPPGDNNKGIVDLVDGKWLCPICRKVCCCAIQACNRNHRHCKAYRYRQRRAEQAAKRTMAYERQTKGGGVPGDAAPSSLASPSQPHLSGNNSAPLQRPDVGLANASLFPGATPQMGALPGAAAMQVQGFGPKGMMPMQMGLGQTSIPMHQVQQQMLQQQGAGMGMVPPSLYDLQGQVQSSLSPMASVAGPQGLGFMRMPMGPTYPFYQ